MAPDITLDELLAEYQRLGLTQNDAGLTTREFGQRWRLGTEATIRRLQMAREAGWLKVGRKMMTRLDGVPCTVACYTLSLPTKHPAGKKKGAAKK